MRAATRVLGAVLMGAMAAGAHGQFILEDAQFVNATLTSEARSARDAHTDRDGFDLRAEGAFFPHGELAEARSDVEGASGHTMHFQGATVSRTARVVRITASSWMFARGAAEPPGEGQTANTSKAEASGSATYILRATERFELDLRGTLGASSTGWSEGRVHAFVYGTGGIVVDQVVSSRSGEGSRSGRLETRVELAPGNYVIQLTALSRIQTRHDGSGGVPFSESAADWNFELSLRGLPRPKPTVRP